MPGLDVEGLPSSSPQFWTGKPLNWGILARVDNISYSLMGITTSPENTSVATVISAEYTSTHTYFGLNAGTTNFTLDFFSPVSPTNYMRQSFPFSYLTISATTSAQSAVRVYVDIDESWTGQTGATVSNFTTSGSLSAFQLSVKGAYTYSENADMALWGEVVLAAKTASNSSITTQSGASAAVRDQFTSSGIVANLEPDYETGDVVAIAQDLGTVTGTASATFAIGYVRDAAVNYLGKGYTGYYRASYPDAISAVSAFLDEYSAAQTESLSLDSDLVSKSTAAAGSNYSDIIALSVRQAYGGLDLTIPASSLDTSGILIFLKEISSDGNVNTVDVIYPAFPIFYVMSPQYIRLLLEPILQYLATGAWHQQFCIHDIGDFYPNATGHNDQIDEPQPIEETGNILILAQAYTLATNDHSMANTYASLFKGYADYLVTNGHNIAIQLSTDDGAGALPNQTNLAIKAAVGLTAYGAMTGDMHYTTIGMDYASQLYNNKIGTDPNQTHFLLEYSDDTSWTTAFNMYPSTLLNLSTFPADAFQMETNWYPTVRTQTGVPLDFRVDWGKTDWMHFAAAYATETATRDMFINDVHEFVGQASVANQAPFSDRFFVTGDRGASVGAYYGFRARPVVGGHFAVLALGGPGTLMGGEADSRGSEEGADGDSDTC